MDYYLYIEPYSLFFRKKDQCLFYNTLNQKALKVDLPNDVSAIVDRLEVDKYVILSVNDMKKEEIQNFVRQLRNTFNGDLLSVSSDRVPPAIFPPAINNQREFEKLNNFEWMERDGQVMNYIEELYLYLNGCQVETDDKVWKQSPSYFCSDQSIDCEKLIVWLKDCSDKHISRINLLGGDVLMYSDWKKVWNVLQQKSLNIQLYYRYDLFTEAHRQILDKAISQLTFVVPMWKINKECFAALIDIINGLEQKTHFLFLIASENDIDLADELAEKYTLEHQTIKPIYTSENLNLFEEMVYLNEREIESTSVDKRDFYAAQKINRNDFGRLTVLPDGQIFANVNFPAISELGKDGIASVIYKEMTEGHSWLRIRDHKPCCDCIYQFLCPSPSNYECVIGRCNLCHVK